jgi:broad specificity phosphatase PhoE
VSRTARVVLVRHGESTWNAARRWQGHGGAGLSALGRAQARQVAAHVAGRFHDIRLTAASDLERVTATAAPSLDALGGLDVPHVVDVRLRELDIGWWTGRTLAEIAERDPQGLAAWRDGRDVPGDMERMDDFRARTRAALDDLLAKLGDEGTLLVFTHGGVVRALVGAALDVEGYEGRRLAGVANGSLTSLTARDGELRLLTYNETGHLTGMPDDAPTGPEVG